MPQWLIVLGSVIGLITGIYTFFEKVLKQRPAMWMRRSASRHDQMLVAVKNRADQDIAIIGNSVRPAIYMLSYNSELDAMHNATMSMPPFRMINPGQVAGLPLDAFQGRTADGQRG
jgi:hypothetical protein